MKTQNNMLIATIVTMLSMTNVYAVVRIVKLKATDSIKNAKIKINGFGTQLETTTDVVLKNGKQIVSTLSTDVEKQDLLRYIVKQANSATRTTGSLFGKGVAYAKIRRGATYKFEEDGIKDVFINLARTMHKVTTKAPATYRKNKSALVGHFKTIQKRLRSYDKEKAVEVKEWIKDKEDPLAYLMAVELVLNARAAAGKEETDAFTNNKFYEFLDGLFKRLLCEENEDVEKKIRLISLIWQMRMILILNCRI